MSGKRDRSAASAVLDASAILAILGRERGHQRVLPVLGRALVSTVNLSEVLAKAPPESVEAEARSIRALGIRAVAFDEGDARRAAQLRELTARAGLSLGDRACLALGARYSLPVWTADAAWARLSLPVEVRLLR